MASPSEVSAVSIARGFRARRRRVALSLVLLACILVAVATAAACIGPVPIAPADVVRVIVAELSGDDPGGPAQTIVWNTRLPRILMAIVAGAMLAAAGAVFQALARNGLADPYLLGINSGASTGAAVVVLVVGSGSALLFSGGALVGAVAAILLVLLLSSTAGTRGPFRIVLAGLAVGYALNAVTSFLIFWSDSPEAARSVLFWLLGSLASVQPIALLAAGAITVLALVALTSAGPLLDALASGDDSARSVGIDPERMRLLLMAATSAAVGVVVAGVGGIGFLGLVVPHLARQLVGSRHRAILPASALLGALLLVCADTVARTALAPQEIPVGVITGVIGAPVLLLLLRGGHGHRSGPAPAGRPHPKTLSLPRESTP
ncbi:ABC transporter permease [Cnuibacter physcomitrellae]|uniref:ABC transporter permease n=1 Tax=Cnuibacter physcomitrellae TaxID=1619308 RepID=A0A1X9LG17_9MICO|nr:iron ABC transporter permease [Cnuibacter physcomitrellae]ARJ04124.1 ABC transporter permease [Cnuibacter physcomitrellae]GGI40318.1 ABC transporter permease [Cnuibacter physcomitrellae]